MNYFDLISKMTSLSRELDSLEEEYQARRTHALEIKVQRDRVAAEMSEVTLRLQDHLAQLGKPDDLEEEVEPTPTPDHPTPRKPKKPNLKRVLEFCRDHSNATSAVLRKNVSATVASTVARCLEVGWLSQETRGSPYCLTPKGQDKLSSLKDALR